MATTITTATFDSCVKNHIVFHDGEIDDIYNLHAMERISQSRGEYICSSATKFQGPSYEVKAKLYKQLLGRELGEVSKILTDGNGNMANPSALPPDDVISGIMMFLTAPMLGKKYLVLTGQCAPVIKVISLLLANYRKDEIKAKERWVEEMKVKYDDEEKEEVSKEPDFEIVKPFSIVWINGRHNSMGIKGSLSALRMAISIGYKDRVELLEFNSYGSVSVGAKGFDPALNDDDLSECCTKGVKIDDPETSIVSEYGRVFNYSLFNNDYFINKVKEFSGRDVSEHILDMTKSERLHKELTQILEGIISNPDVPEKEKGYFKPKKSIWEEKFIQFPLHDLAAYMIMKGSDKLKSVDAVCLFDDPYIKVVKSGEELGGQKLIHVKHFYAPNPKEYVKEISQYVQENIV